MSEGSALLVRRLAHASAVLAAYVTLAVAITWPLASQLRSALPGDIHGDTGVYVWNLWVFSHEVLKHGRWPLSTDLVFAATGGADFSLHNYTPLADLVALPLIPLLGLVGAYNVVLLLALSSSGGAAYWLARHHGYGRPASLVGGAVFMALPMVGARVVAHLSLVTNAALPLFLLTLDRALEKPSAGRGMAVGTIVAAAAYSDAYYGVFCVLMGVFVLGWRHLSWDRGVSASLAALRWLDVGTGTLVVVALASHLGGRAEISLMGLRITGLRTPYLPVLLATLTACVRVWLTWRPSWRVSVPPEALPRLVRTGAVAVVTSLVWLAPLLVGLAIRWQRGRLPRVPIFWRSGPRGVDVLAYAVPSPIHALWGARTERWLLPPVQDAFPELVASCAVTLLVALWLSHRRKALPAMWIGFTGLFASLSLGPFIHVAGVNTLVPGPWAVLRYVPVIGLARSPSRFALVAGLGVAMLAAAAVEAWPRRLSARAGTAAWLMALLCAFELIPGGRPLYPAAAPRALASLTGQAADERERVLFLPTGIRDGTSSVGDFSASTLFFQTAHGRPLLGGYLSRVSDWRREASERDPVYGALLTLSGPSGSLTSQGRDEAAGGARAFLDRNCVRYVVVDKGRASGGLTEFATDVFGLARIDADAEYELLAPLEPPRCESTPN